MTRLRYLFLLAVPLATAHAQDSVSLDPTIAYVTTGGSWSDGNGAGHYRVIVRTDGFEHVGSELFIEWLQDPRSEADSETVRARVVVDSITPGIYNLDLPQIACKGTRCQIQVHGLNTRNMEKASWIITIERP